MLAGPLVATTDLGFVERGTAWLLAAMNDDGGWGQAPGEASRPDRTFEALEILFAVPAFRDRDPLAVARHRGFL